MPCQHYKDALVEAAATGVEPQGELRTHLAACSSCRAAFAEEQSLFGSIDAGLHATANAEVPPSLLPRVRSSLDELVAAPRFRWVQPLVFASASVAFAFLIFLVARPRHAPPEDTAKPSPITVPFPTAPATAANSEKTSRESAQVAGVHVSHSHAARNSTNLHSAASSNPEVLVPPDEREVLARFVATLNERGDLATALLAPAREGKDALVSVDPLQIADMEIKPLESKETETSDGAGEMR